MTVISIAAILTADDTKQPIDRNQKNKPCKTKILHNGRMADSQVRQNFEKDCEDALNIQINKELYASYVYLSMAYYFDRDDVALPGLHKYFLKASDEEREHATKFMKYVNKRGGRIVLTDIKAPERAQWGTAEDAMLAALDLEKVVNESLLALHKLATEHGDANLCDFLETEYLQEQVDAIKQIGDHLTNIRRVGEGLGIFIFDKEIKEMHESQ